MWSRHLIKQTLCAVRIQRSSSMVILQNASRLFQQNIRLYAAAPTEELDLLFNLGRDGGKSKKMPKRDAGLSPKDEANVLEAINFNPDNRSEQSKKVNRRRAKTGRTEPSEEEIAAKVEKNIEDKAIRKKLKAEAPTFDELTYHDASMDLSYVKLPLNHPQMQTLMLLTRSKKYRTQKHLLMIEGKRLIEDSLDAGLQLKYLFFSRLEKLELIKDLLHTKCKDEMPKIFRVPQHDLTFWSVMTTCPGLIAIFERPDDMTTIWDTAVAQNANEMENSVGPRISVICDQIREPNNIGSIIRTCAALPCSQVILMKGCTDPWDTKALRGGCGGQFRVPIRGPVEWSSLPSFLPDPHQYSVFVASNKLEQTIAGTRRKFASTPYSTVPFVRCNHIVLIIGGETEGVSDEAIQFMANSNAENKSKEDEFAPPKNSCIHISLSNGVESLNSNAAAAIMLFEIRKQLSGN